MGIKKLDLYTIVLAVNNLVGGILHIIFEFYLLKEQSIYRGFLLIENMLITAVFIYFCYGLLLTNKVMRITVIKQNVLFWLVFAISFFLFQPEITSLVIYEKYLPLGQKEALQIIGSISFAISLLSYRETYKLSKKTFNRNTN